MTVEDLRTERVCPRCGYSISPGFWHREQPQPEGASHVVCSLERANGMILKGPLVEVLNQYLTELNGVPQT